MATYGSGANCRTLHNAKQGDKWFYSLSYVCAYDYSYSILNWENNAGTHEVLFRAVANGNNPIITVNNSNVINNKNGKNAYALTDQSCGSNGCWNNDAFRNNAIPVKKVFSGNLIIYAKGQADGWWWGGSSSIWGVFVRSTSN